MKNISKNRWGVVLFFFMFMLLHQTDKLLITPLAPQIINCLSRGWRSFLPTMGILFGQVYCFITRYKSRDIEKLRSQMRERAETAIV